MLSALPSLNPRLPRQTLTRYSVRSIVVLVLLQLASCAQRPILEPLGTHKSAPAQTRVWECEHNFAFVTREEGDAMWLFLPNHAVQLPRVVDRSGISYHSKDIDFQQKNGQARLELPDGHYEHCQNNTQRAAWEHARLNGVDFRATGNSPDWVLEITLDGDMQLSMDSNGATHHFVTPEPLVIERDHKTLYSTQNTTHQIIVELTGTPCRDVSTGETREVTVNISLDDRRLKGCGAALH